MPRTSDPCARVCEILALYELLTRRRPDLRLELGESFLGLVGRRGRRSLPPVAKSRTRAIIKDGLAQAKREKIKVETPLDLLATALELAPEVLTPQFSPTRELSEAEIATQIIDLLSGPVKRQHPSPALAEPSQTGFWRKRLKLMVQPLKVFTGSDRAQDIACGIAIPFALKAITAPHLIVKAGGAVALLGCGMELADDTPQRFRGIPIPSQLQAVPTPRALTGGAPTPTSTPIRRNGD